MGATIAVFILTRQLAWSRSIAIGLIIWSLFALTLAVSKLLFFDDLRLQPPKHITRERSVVGVPHESFSVSTEDNVEIVGFHIRNGHSKLIIFCHGGGRCKNSFATLSLAQWFSYDYDVIAYDTRGHFESGGNWTADGKTKLDLLAVLDYARQFQYDKIGVMGRSFGGWTATLVASEFGGIDCLVLIATPLLQIRELPFIRRIEMLKYGPGRLLVRALHGLRFRDYEDDNVPTPSDLLAGLDIPVFLIYSQKDEVINLTGDDVQRIYEKMTGLKKMYVFADHAHLPQPWHLGPIFMMCRDWFAKTLT